MFGIGKIASDEVTLLEQVHKIQEVVREMGSSSLPEYTSPTRLSPVVLIDKSLTVYEDETLKNILQTMVAIYSAHYMQAVMINTNVQGINTMRLLDQFSTDRDINAAGIGAGWADLINAVGESNKLDFIKFVPGREARTPTDDSLQGHVNLAIGRLLYVKIGVDKCSITIPVSVIINPRVIDSGVLPNVLAMVDTDTSFIGRYHKWRAGEIESFMDFALALDLIEKDRKAMSSNDSDIYKEARAAKTKSLFKTLITGRSSLNTASTMAVISTGVAEELELAIKGRLKNPRDRHKYFVATNSMMLVVVDNRRERLTIYQRGIAEYGTYTFMDVEDYNKKSSTGDISSILKAYKLGESPTL